jgi:epsin
VAAKELTALVLDEDRLRSERSDRKLWKTRVSGLDEGYGNSGAEPPRKERRRRNGDDESDTEYRLAIEASKAEAEEERRRRAKESMANEDDEDLAKAIRLSREEEELRKRELEESNAQSLFDDTPAQVQPTGYNQGYQQQGAVDWFGNPINAQQPMTTGYLNSQYAQPTGFQNQPTGMNNPYANGYQTQPSAFDQNPYGQQQNNYLQPQAALQPQQTAFNPNNPYGGDIFSQQQQQQQQPQENYQTAGSNNPWAGNQPQQNLQPADALKPMPTGSNNPFAQRQQTQFNNPAPTGPPTLNALSEDRATNQFAQNNSQHGQNSLFSHPTQPNPIANFQAPQPPKSTTPQDPHHARLNALLSTGEGLDTFGNVGDLRIPAQHTTPGTFVNSAGQGLDRLHATPTRNPFLGQQFTGMPQQTGYVQQQQQQQPANNNPWGGQQQQQRGGSLIDL